VADGLFADLEDKAAATKHKRSSPSDIVEIVAQKQASISSNGDERAPMVAFEWLGVFVVKLVA
jgi:hypothetical protein